MVYVDVLACKDSGPIVCKIMPDLGKKICIHQKKIVTIIELHGNSSNVISTFPVMVIGCLLNEGGQHWRPHMLV